MRVRFPPCLVSFSLGSALMFSITGVHAQSTHLVIKSGESIELHDVIWIRNCASIIVGTPEIEVLDGPAELTLAYKPGMIIPRAQRCAKPVLGGTVIATAKDVKEPGEAKLTYRIKLKTKIGDRQEGRVFNVSLFP
jgi:hypothetical protein